MIDIENAVIDRITQAVTGAFPGATVLGDYIEEIESFPTVTVTEINNETLLRMQDDAGVEHYARITYEVNIYTNDRVGKKTKAKDVMDVIDEVMFPLNFVRRTTRRLMAIDHSRTVFRLYARYQVIADEGTTITEDGEEVTTHYLYRR